MTTEFWGAVFLQIVDLLVLFGVIHSTQEQLDVFVKSAATLAMAFVYIFYSLSRGKVKAAQAAVVSAEVTSGTIAPPDAAT